MATTHDFYTLSSSAAARLTPATASSGYQITVQNVSQSGYVYLGSEDVSPTSYGFRLGPDQHLSIDLPGKSTLFALSSVDMVGLAVLKTNIEGRA